MKENSLVFAKTRNKKKADMVSFLLEGEGRICPKEEFLSLHTPGASAPGSILLHCPDGFTLTLTNNYELRLAKLLASSGLFEAIHGQTYVLPYTKPWASNPSPYYPDFIAYTKDHRILFLELKSILGMAQDETILKYRQLAAFCKKRGYLYAMVDVDLLRFEEYFWPFPKNEAYRYIAETIEAQGGFNENNLKHLLSLFPKTRSSSIKRELASFILQDPYLENRYCHDDPNLVNAVKVKKQVSYK